MEDTNKTGIQGSSKNIHTKKKGKWIILIIAGVGCLLVACALVCTGIYLWLKDSEDEDSNTPNSVVNEDTSETDISDDEEQPQDNETDNQEDQTTPYNGKTITATLPTGWTIQEYYDGEGSSMLPEGTYDGLTGVVVKNSSGNSVFKMEAVSGIGGIDICQTIYKFGDTEETYVTEYFNKTKDFNQSVIPPDPDPTIVDLSAKSYTEFTLLNKQVRRVDSDLYFNMSSKEGVFNPACGMYESIQTFNGLTYSYVYMGTSDTLDSYHVYITETAKSSELQLLDDILDSMKVKSS